MEEVSKMKTRSEAREAIIKILYKIAILNDAKVEDEIDNVIQEVCPISNAFVTNTVHEIVNNKDALDQLANNYMIDWEIKRLNKVDQAIFRLGIYELVYTDTPSVVAINEAIELSKKYSDTAITKMLNGVLDQIYHNEDISHE